MSHPEPFYGDNMRWWVGIVINTLNDPLSLGRAQVRIDGIHSNEIPDDWLPWASVVLPTTSGGISGTGTNAWLQPNARVIGIFADGKLSQNPIILGSLPMIQGSVQGVGRRSTPTNRGGQAYSEGRDAYPPRNPDATPTNFVATDQEAKEAVEERYGPLTNEEFTDLVAVTSSEAGRGDQEEMAYVAATVMNRRRDGRHGSTVWEVISHGREFSSVTGPSYVTQHFRNGPTQSRAERIYGAYKEYMRSVPDDVYFFHSANPAAFGAEGSSRTLADVNAERESWGLNGRVIGDSWFFFGRSPRTFVG